MNKIFTIENFLKMFYPDSCVPSYLYKGEHLLDAQPPGQTDLTCPPDTCLAPLFADRNTISYLSTDYGIYYGCIRIHSMPGHRIVFGPVNLTPYSESELHRMYADYVVPMENHGEFRSFLQRIPQLSLSAFLLKLVFVNYCVNQEILQVSQIFPAIVSEGVRETAKSTEDLYEKKSFLEHNSSHEVESVILEMIRSGNPDGLRSTVFNDSHVHTGITGPTPLRQLKNNIIITTTISTRAAIDGGLDPDTAFQLSDTFIQTAEQTNDPNTLNELLGKICYTFASRVREVQTPVTSDSVIMQAIRYIQQNTCSHITAADVAEHMGFSRSYFSSYFKSALGFSVSDFIMRCKMEEAKQLLRHTTRPVSVISSYLCFSSQSHFQAAFKKQFGMTPLQYRRDTQKKESGQGN